VTSTTQATKKPKAPPATVPLPSSASYVLVDVGTGNVLAADNEHLRLSPASLTKILTALIAVTYLPPGAGVPGTTESADAYPNDVGIEKGVPWSLHDVLESLLVLSANDAAYALAQRISGSLATFGTVMERAAHQLGMTDAPLLRDPAGLDGTEGFEGGNLVSARDLAIAGRDFLQVPELARIVAQRSYHFVDPTGTSHYLPTMNYAFLVSYPGAIGMKTGFTDKAGSCIMAAAKRGRRTMLAVVMDGYDPTQSAIDLLNEGFQTPVPAEPARDRLPPPALPRPVPSPGSPSRLSGGRRVGHSPHPQVRTGAGNGSVPGSPDQRRAGPGRAGPLAAGPLAAAPRTAAAGGDRAAVPPRPRHGLSSVLSAWPAQLLLLLAGTAALFALWELRSLQQVSERSRRSSAPYRPETVPVNVVAGGRRRRAQLVASYRRHERP
jgi:D-alanyl-D-alanine carboxypeptidase